MRHGVLAFTDANDAKKRHKTKPKSKFLGKNPGKTEFEKEVWRGHYGYDADDRDFEDER